MFAQPQRLGAAADVVFKDHRPHDARLADAGAVAEKKPQRFPLGSMSACWFMMYQTASGWCCARRNMSPAQRGRGADGDRLDRRAGRLVDVGGREEALGKDAELDGRKSGVSPSAVVRVVVVVDVAVGFGG